MGKVAHALVIMNVPMFILMRSPVTHLFKVEIVLRLLVLAYCTTVKPAPQIASVEPVCVLQASVLFQTENHAISTPMPVLRETVAHIMQTRLVLEFRTQEIVSLQLSV